MHQFPRAYYEKIRAIILLELRFAIIQNNFRIAISSTHCTHAYCLHANTRKIILLSKRLIRMCTISLSPNHHKSWQSFMIKWTTLRLPQHVLQIKSKLYKSLMELYVSVTCNDYYVVMWSLNYIIGCLLSFHLLSIIGIYKMACNKRDSHMWF